MCGRWRAISKRCFWLRCVEPRRTALGVVLALLSGCALGSGRHSPVAEVGRSLVHEARRVDVLGETPTAAHSARPVRRNDLARYLAERPALEVPPGEEPPAPTADARFAERLEGSLEAELDDVLAPEGGAEGTWVKPFERSELRIVGVDEPWSVYNEQGREFHEGLNLYLSQRASLRFAERLSLTVQPELSFVQNANSISSGGDSSDLTLRFQELEGSLRFGFAEATFGRLPLWWGPGRHGALLLSNNARPFDMVRLGTAGLQQLPGWLGWLGLIQVETFATRLDRDRPVSKPYLWGMRISTRLNPWLEIGASRTAQFGGSGRSVRPSTLWSVLTADTENTADDPGNQLASFDLRVLLPFESQPIELYTEIGGEDEANFLFSREAWLAGIYLPRIGPCDALELTIEVTDTAVAGERRVWYTNGNFPDGYTYHEDVIGHHVGTDGLDIFAELRYRPLDWLTAKLSFDYEEHFREDPVRESVYQARLGLDFSLPRGLSLQLTWGADFWQNFRQRRHDDPIGQALGVGLRWVL